MPKSFLTIIGITVVIGSIIIIWLWDPARFHSELSIMIEAPPEVIHPYINNFRNWRKWPHPDSTSTKITYEGPEEGVGAKQFWKRREYQVFMIITKSEPGNGVWYDTGLNSNEANIRSSFTYEVVNDGTRVTWTADGNIKPEVGRGSIMRIKHGGEDIYDAKLKRLKKIVESELSSATKMVEEKE